MEKKEKVQYNFKIDIEDKEKIIEIAGKEAERLNVEICPAHMTRLMIKYFIKKYENNEIE